MLIQLVVIIIWGILLPSTTGDVETAPIPENLGEDSVPKISDNTRSPIKIAIIDTGINLYKYINNVPLCDEGHFDFDKGRSGLGMDEENHGTVVANILTDKLEANKYCLLIYDVYSEKNTKASYYLPDAIKLAIYHKAKIINISMSGKRVSRKEEEALKSATQNNIKVFVSAGNDEQNLNKVCDLYPVCYPFSNMYVVGSNSYRSNYGRVVDLCLSPPSKYTLNPGTSFSSPRAANAYLRIKDMYSDHAKAWKLYLSKNKCKERN